MKGLILRVSSALQTVGAADLFAGRLSVYVSLSKPRIAVMAMFCVCVGYFLGLRGVFDVRPMLSACLGILAVAVCCSFLNQLIERDVDARMNRTVNRPLVSGRVSSSEVMVVGFCLGVFGVAWLATQVNALTAIVSAITLFSYVVCYTPLKRVSFLCTQVGALAGALPPVLGWCASGSSLDYGALSLLLLMFCWQFPHFLGIATIYRSDYERAGLRMLPVMVGGQSCAGSVSVAYAVALLPVSFLVYDSGIAGDYYLIVAVVGWVAYLIAACRFWICGSVGRARDLVLCSLIYLPVLLTVIVVDHSRSLQ